MPHLNINDISRDLYLLGTKSIVIIALCMVISACGGSGGGASGSDIQVSLSGEITVQRDSDVDLDINQSISLNNDITDPQFILNPSTIGGYLSGYSGAYPTSNITFTEDAKDYFNVSLVEGQEIQLSVFKADASLITIELELALFDEFQNKQISVQLDKFNSSSLIVPVDGLYTLGLSVSSQSSPLLYTLTLSQTISGNSSIRSDKQDLSLDFIAGEVLLKFKEDVQELSSSKAQSKSLPLKHAPSLYNALSNEPLFNRLKFKENVSNIANLYQFNELLDTQMVSSVNSKIYIEPEAQAEFDLRQRKSATLELINILKLNDQVEFAEPNFIYRSTATTNDPRLSDQWNLSMLSSSAVWEVATGQGVVVAVLDSGINASHEDLMTNIHPEGYDFISDTKSSGDGNGFDADPYDEGTSFHGSHVAGIIAAEADNNLGIAGLAYNAQIMPLRVLGVQDTGSSSDIAQAILYAAGLANTSGNVPVQKADIINMSFGGEALSETVQLAVEQAFNQGLILIAAAGNGSTDKPFYPAAFENVIGVGSISSDKEKSSFSNFGVNVQVVAPGGTGSGSASYDGFQDAILSTVNANNYTEYLGTSMAAPHVSAVAALMKELKADLNGSSFKLALDSGFLTENLNSSSPVTNNYFGNGLIDSAKAVNWAAGSTLIPAILNVYPTNFGFIGSITEADLNLTNPGNGNVTVLSVTEQESWLEVTEKNVDQSSGLGTYLVEVNPSLAFLDQGLITISYRIDNGAIQEERLSVFISRNLQSDPSIGSVHVFLYKEDDVLNGNYIPALGVAPIRNNGTYTYSFKNVPPGRYLLSASTDNDKDQVAFDNGEAVGVFPLLSRPEFIELNDKSLNNVNFDIAYPSFRSSEVSISEITKLNKLSSEPFQELSN